MTWDELVEELTELVPVRLHEILKEALLDYRSQCDRGADPLGEALNSGDGSYKP